MRTLPVLALILLATSAYSADGPGSQAAEILQALVETQSGSEDSAGLGEMRKLVAAAFGKLGFQAKNYPLAQGHQLTVLSQPGASPDVLLVGHIDTVFPKDTAFTKLTKEGDRWRGPGIIDMKGGLVLAWEALSLVKDRSRFMIMINDDEETGSKFSAANMDELAKPFRYALIFEPGLPGGEVVTGHAGVAWFELSVQGRAAHAGLEHARGVNACVELSHQLAEAARLTDYERSLTVNVGVVQGGTKPNVVCEKATATIDIRSRSDADLDAVLEKLGAIQKSPVAQSAEDGARPTSSIKELVRIPPMDSASTDELFALAKAASAAAGQGDLTGKVVGYGSDGNHLARTGIQLLVGLGPYGGEMHSDREWMSASGYSKRLALVRALLESLPSGQGR